MKTRRLVLLLLLATAGCDPPPEDYARPCGMDTADPVINSCYYCCFAEPGQTGAMTGCFMGTDVTEERCREHLIADKSCTDPLELEIQLDCQCHVDCDDPDWF